MLRPLQFYFQMLLRTRDTHTHESEIQPYVTRIPLELNFKGSMYIGVVSGGTPTQDL